MIDRHASDIEIPTDQEVLKRGAFVFVGVPLDGRAQEVEERIVRLAKESGARVDWHYEGGRVVVQTLGDATSVLEKARELWPRWTAGFTIGSEGQPL